MKLYTVHTLPTLSGEQRELLIARLGADADDTEFGLQSFEACMNIIQVSERADAAFDAWPVNGSTGAQPLPDYADSGFVRAQ